MRSVTISRLLSGLLASFLIGGLAPALLPGYVAMGQTGQSSLALNGTSASAEAPSASELNTIADWTVEAWFKDETPGGYNHTRERIITKGDTGTSSDVPYFIDITTNSLFVGRRVSGTSQVLSASLSGVTANKWHHVAATFQVTPSRFTLYLDGNQVATSTFTGVNIGNTNP